MNLKDVQTLFAYNAWANRRMFSALEKLSEEQFAAAVQSSFPSIRESVLHIVAAEWIWLKRWKGTSPLAATSASSASAKMLSALQNGGVVTDRLSTVAGLRSFAESVEQERQIFLHTLNENVLDARLNYRGMDGKEFSQPLAQLMQHVVNHGTYHRGR